MCRKNQAMGGCMAAAGVGALLAVLLGGGVCTVLVALALVAAGVVLAGKK